MPGTVGANDGLAEVRKALDKYGQPLVAKRQEQVPRFFEDDANATFNRTVSDKLEASKAYMVYLQEKGLLEDPS